MTQERTSCTFTTMEIEPDLLRIRAEGIGAKLDNASSVLLYRGYTPLGQEISQGVLLSIPRTGYSPRYASFQVTLKCHLDCPECNVKNMRNKQRIPDLTTEEAYKVEDRLSQVGIQWVDITGGEPLLREDLLKIIEHSRELGMKTTINTNGGIALEDLDKEKARWRNLAEVGLKGATFSFNGTGEKNDSRVIELAAYLVHPLHIYSGVRTVVTKDNLKYVRNIGEACMSNDVFYEAVPAIALGGEISANPSDNFHPLDEEGRNEYIEIMRSLRGVRGPFANLLHVGEDYLKKVVAPVEEWKCKDPARYLIFVNAQGELAVCNDKPLVDKTYSLIGEENPLLKKDFYKAVKAEATKCNGCRWLCNWRSQQRQALNRFYITAAAFT